MDLRGADMAITDEEFAGCKKIELEILLEFDRICKKYNISYQLFAGTLLGAVRHKGFIPWDDDIDVCLLRKEYERFLKVCTKEELGDSFFLQTNETDPLSVLQFAKIRKNNTVFENVTDCNPSTHTGIYIDIFPFDNVKPETSKGIRQYKDFDFYYKIVTSSEFNRVKNASSLRNKVIRFCFYLMQKIIPKRYFDKKLHDILNRFNDEETEYVNHLTNGTNDKRTKWFLRNRESFMNNVEMEFEGHFFPVPADYDAVLRQRYGDYMKLPPVEQRKPHHGIIRVKF